MAKVKIMETVLRDAGQSLIATRMPIEEMLPIVDSIPAFVSFTRIRGRDFVF